MTDSQYDSLDATFAQSQEGDEWDDLSRVMRESLAEFDLEEEDYSLLDGFEESGFESYEASPILAVVGRPNVGKSSLVNRIVGERVAVVQDVPGVTRDRVAYRASWAGKDFILLDTGGWELDVEGIDKSVAEQAERAVEGADAVALVVDANVGITHSDEHIVKMLRRTKKPIILVANKVDSPMQEADAASLWALGLGEPHPISALHGRGTGDLLDEIIRVLPEFSSVEHNHDLDGLIRVALLGRPNVGKSSLLNRLAGAQRVVVDPLAGTTRDPVDEIIELDGQQWVFVDTAGIRRRVHQTRGADYYASLRTAHAVEKADVALILIDGSLPLTEQDIRVIQQAVDAGRACVLVVNKWDVVDEERRLELDKQLERELVQLQWIERINLSALTGWHTNRLTRAMEKAVENWHRRIPTGKLNSFLGELVAAHPHPVRGGKQPRILFATQAQACPPRFVLFTSGFLEAGYRRFIENQLRENFDFTGTPIEISVRVRQRRKR